MTKKTLNTINLAAAGLCILSAIVAMTAEDGSSLSSNSAIIGAVFAVMTVAGIVFKNVKFKD